MSEIKKVAIVGGNRIPFCRSVGPYKEVGNKEMMTAALKGLVDQYDLQGEALGEVVLGAVLKRAVQFSLARECTIDSGLSYATPATDIQKACGTSLEAASIVANKIALGQIEVGIGAGVDTSSDVPIELSIPLSRKLVQMSKQKSLIDRATVWKGFNPIKDLVPRLPAVNEPRTGKSMGQHCEMMAQEWGVTREDQDELSYNSHRNAAAAYEANFFSDMITPYQGVDKDNNVRPDTSLEKLAKLRTAFSKSDKATLTAANSTPLTDGAAAVLLCSEEYAQKKGWKILGYLSHYETTGVDYVEKEGLLMAPAYAVPKMLDKAGLTLQDFDFYEIHEAFAAQVLCTLKAWNDEKFCKEKLGRSSVLGEIDRSKLNVKGGSVALGHPFAATGARILSTAAKILDENGGGRCLISICTAGGMGTVAIVER